jgi:hypothetical protein
MRKCRIDAMKMALGAALPKFSLFLRYFVLFFRVLPC